MRKNKSIFTNPRKTTSVELEHLYLQIINAAACCRDNAGNLTDVGAAYVDSANRLKRLICTPVNSFENSN